MMGTKRKKMDFAGLRRRETYQEIINYLENEQEIIHYPNRTAKVSKGEPIPNTVRRRRTKDTRRAAT